MTPAVLFDRDGTLLEEVGYLDRLERMRLFPYVIDAVRLLKRAGFRIVVVTNQAGVARGYFDESVVRDIHARLDEQFRAGGAAIDGIYYCPHHPDGSAAAYAHACECRKPKPGLVFQAQADHDLDLARSFVVGDRWLDMELAARAGARGILVRTGFGASEATRPPANVSAAAIVNNLIDATTWILRNADDGRSV